MVSGPSCPSLKKKMKKVLVDARQHRSKYAIIKAVGETNHEPNMTNKSKSKEANQFENWSKTNFDILVDMYDTFQNDCPDSEQTLTGFINHMYEHGQDVVADWYSRNVDVSNN